MKRVYIAGDLHAPWTSTACLDFFFRDIERDLIEDKILKRKVQIAIVQIGDAYDFFSFSRFPGTRNLIKADDEIVRARVLVEEFWKRCKKVAPKAELYQLMGNHDIRPLKYCLENAPFLETFISSGLKELFKFDGITTVPENEELMIDGNVYIHGHTNSGRHFEEYLSNVILGHTHNGCVHTKRFFRQLNEKFLFELNAGYMGMPEEKCFSYKRRTFKWTRGYGKVSEDNVPSFHLFQG